MRGRILLTGTFCSLNKGDAAMRIALTDALHKAIPGCHVGIMTPYPELDANAYRCDELIACSRRRPARALMMVIRAGVWNIFHKLRLNPDFILDAELRKYRESDVVVDLSGDGLTEEYGAKCLLAHLIPIILGELLCRPVFVCAQTIGPLKKTRLISKWALKKADVVTARERLTLNYLTDLGLTKRTLSLVADLAFLMEPTTPDGAREVLKREGVPMDKPLIGLSVSKLPGHLLGDKTGEKISKTEAEIAKTLDKIMEMGIHPVFISHATGPGDRRDDRRAAFRVAALTSTPENVTVLKEEYSPEKTKAIIGLMDMFVGVRMHSCIGALSMNVPTISIAYGPKAFGIMGLAGQRERTIDIREITAEKLFSLIQQTWESRSQVSESLRAEMIRVFALSEQNVEIIRGLLHDSSCADSPQVTAN